MRQTSPEKVRVTINLFGDSTRIASALGLDIELPDCDNEDPSYWAAVWAEGWKPKLRGKVADVCERGDPEWAELVALPYAEIWYDVEEGVVFRTTVGGLAEAMACIRGLETKGIPLFDPADGKSNVLARDQGLGQVAAEAARFETLGLTPYRFVQNDAVAWWELVRERR